MRPESYFESKKVIDKYSEYVLTLNTETGEYLIELLTRFGPYPLKTVPPQEQQGFWKIFNLGWYEFSDDEEYAREYFFSFINDLKNIRITE